MYPPTGCYGAPPHPQSYPSTPAPSKASSITNSAHSADFYQSNHQHHHVPQHHVAPLGPPAQTYATLPPPSGPPPSNAQYNQQQPSYATPQSYYGQQVYYAPPAQRSSSSSSQQHHQPTLASAAASGPGAPLYPIVSYPSAPGSSQYGTLSSTQSNAAPAVMPPQVGAPVHQYNSSQPASTAAVHSGYSAPAPPSRQLAPTVNGQGSTGLFF